MTRLHLIKLALPLLLLASASAANAELQARSLDGNDATTEAYYDTDLGVTWLADANLALTQQFGATVDLGGDIPGAMTRDAADTFIAGMNAAGYLGYGDWRLPEYLLRDELGSLLTTLTGYDSIPNTFAPLIHLTLIPFNDIGFWSADPIDASGNYADYPVALRVSFSGAGANWVDPSAFPNRVLPVLSGSVGVAVLAVPELPAPVSLAAGLALLLLARRHRGI